MTQAQTVDTVSQSVDLQSRFTPLIDLNNKSTSELSVKNAFALAEKNVEKSFVEMTRTLITKKEFSKKMQFGLAILGTIALGFVAMQIVGALIAGSLAFGAAVGLWYFWEYRLPLIINRAKSELITQGREASLREKEKLRQIEIDHIARLKAMAKRNPIEQAESEYLNRGERFNTFKSALEKIGAKLKATDSKIARKKLEPTSKNFDFRQIETELGKANAWYKDRLDRLATAKIALVAFHNKLDEARFKWEIQLDMNDAIRSMNATDRDSKINEMLVEIAFDTVQKEFDTIFAKMEVDAAEVNSTKELRFGSISIDTSDVNVPVQKSETKTKE